MSRTSSRSRPSPHCIDRADWDASRGGSRRTSIASWRCSTRPACGRRSSPSAGSPSAIPRWCAASSPPGTSWPATAGSTSAPTRRTRRRSAPTWSARALMLEDIGGVPVTGYRAATFSIGARNLWAFGVLREAGYATAPASIPIRTICTACRTRRACRSDPEGGRVVGNPDDHRARRSAATGRAPAAAISGCCRTGCTGAAFRAVNRR